MGYFNNEEIQYTDGLTTAQFVREINDRLYEIAVILNNNYDDFLTYSFTETITIERTTTNTEAVFWVPFVDANLLRVMLFTQTSSSTAQIVDDDVAILFDDPLNPGSDIVDLPADTTHREYAVSENQPTILAGSSVAAVITGFSPGDLLTIGYQWLPAKLQSEADQFLTRGFPESTTHLLGRFFRRMA